MRAAWLIVLPHIISSIALSPQPVPDRIESPPRHHELHQGAGGDTLLWRWAVDPDGCEVFITVVGPSGEFWDRAEAAGVKTQQLPGFSPSRSRRSRISPFSFSSSD